MNINGVDTKEFGIQVERLCDFLLDQFFQKTGSNSQRIIEDIKNDAIKLQKDDGENFLDRLESHMRGVPQ